MARSYRPVVRDQRFLLPPDMADWLAEGHLVWFVIEVVAQLDTVGFHALRRTGGVGRAGYDPDMLLALLVYAYACGVRSSRQIERLCATDVAFRVLCGQDTPDHTTIARFRAAHDGAFAELFAQVLRLCAASGMVKVGVVAIDGTKIAANAARGANRSPQTVRDEARRIADEILAEAEQIDAAEDARETGDGGSGGSGGIDGGLPAGFASRSGRAANINKALQELARQDRAHAEADAADRARVEKFLTRVEAGEAAVGVPPAGTDLVRYHRARVVRQQRRIAELEGVRGSRAVRARGDARKLLSKAEASVAQTLAQQAGGDTDPRTRSARQRDRRERAARARGGSTATVNVTDPDSRLMTLGAGGGSVQGYNAQIAVTDDHLVLAVQVSQDANDTHCWSPTLTAATAQADALGKNIELVLADAGYFTDENLIEPGPDRLIAAGKNREVYTDARDHPTDGPSPPHAHPIDAMRHRLRQPHNAERYKRRSATVEPVIGHLKDHTRLRRFARRGLPAVTAELNLAAAVINLTRLRHATATA